MTARAALAGAALAALFAASCGPREAEQEAADGTPAKTAASDTLDLVVTAATEEQESAIAALTALPNASYGYGGVVVAAPRAGGLRVISVDARAVAEFDGGAFGSLAAAPDFQLRGSALPLFAAADLESGGVRLFAYSSDRSDLFEAPADGLQAAGEIRAVCAGASDISQLEFFTLGAEGAVGRWRVRDTGGERLAAERVDGFTAPFEARRCVYDEETGALYLTSPLSELARVDPGGETAARRNINVEGVGFANLSGQSRLVAALGDGLQLLDPATLETRERLSFGPGLTVPGLADPGALAVSPAAYGGAYPDGFFVAADDGDNRVKFIDFGYVERELAAPENRFAPNPPRES